MTLSMQARPFMKLVVTVAAVITIQSFLPHHLLKKMHILLSDLRLLPYLRCSHQSAVMSQNGTLRHLYLMEQKFMLHVNGWETTFICVKNSMGIITMTKMCLWLAVCVVVEIINQCHRVRIHQESHLSTHHLSQVSV